MYRKRADFTSRTLKNNLIIKFKIKIEESILIESLELDMNKNIIPVPLYLFN